MKIAVIGTGNIGAAYPRALAAAQYEVVVGDRDPGKAAALAQEIGAKAEGGGMSASAASACSDNSVVIDSSPSDQPDREGTLLKKTIRRHAGLPEGHAIPV